MVRRAIDLNRLSGSKIEVCVIDIFGFELHHPAELRPDCAFVATFLAMINVDPHGVDRSDPCMSCFLSFDGVL